MRDHALSLACLHQGLPARDARGYDQPPEEILTRLDRAHVVSLDPEALHAALVASVRALMIGGSEANLPQAAIVNARLSELR